MRTPYTWPENTEPSDEQVAGWLAVCTHEERLERVRWWRESARQAQDCFVQNHARRLLLIDPNPGKGRHRAV